MGRTPLPVGRGVGGEERLSLAGLFDGNVTFTPALSFDGEGESKNPTGLNSALTLLNANPIMG